MGRTTGLWQSLRDAVFVLRALHERERQRLREEIARVPGLMALLMKPRNGQTWSTAEREMLRMQLRGIKRLGFYIVMIVVPGTVVTLPLLAWWLDRRALRRLADRAAYTGIKPYWK